MIEKGSELLETFKRTEESGSHRTFCRGCGTPVLVDHPTVSMIDVPAVSVHGLAFKPSLHSHYPERVLSIHDGLPKYKDFQPEVGGSSETVGE